MARFPWKALTAGGIALGAIRLAFYARDFKRELPERVALIGDSYAVGLGPKLKGLIPAFEYEGFVGTNTAQWASHAPPCGRCGDWLAGYKPTLVLVSLGTNDGAAPSLRNYQDIVRRIHGLGARVVWIEPPAGVVEAAPAREVIARLGVQTVPATNVALGSDGLHPSGYGYSAWAHEIAEAVHHG